MPFDPYLIISNLNFYFVTIQCHLCPVPLTNFCKQFILGFDFGSICCLQSNREHTLGQSIFRINILFIRIVFIIGYGNLIRYLHIFLKCSGNCIAILIDSSGYFFFYTQFSNFTGEVMPI